MNLLNIETRISTLQAELLEEKEAHKKKVAGLSKSIHKLISDKDVLLANIDLDKVLEAENILLVRHSEFVESVVTDAIYDIVQNTQYMKMVYYGAKNYEGFRHQRSDHPYNMGPRHGYIVFSIGLKHDYRGAGLTDEEKDSCLYYLNTLLDKSKRKQLLDRLK